MTDFLKGNAMDNQELSKTLISSLHEDLLFSGRNNHGNYKIKMD